MIKKHGAIECARLVIRRVYRRIFQNAHYVFVLQDVSDSCGKLEFPDWIQITRHAQLSEVPACFIQTLAERKGGEAHVHRLLSQQFDRGADLWVATVDGKSAGYHWTARYGPDGFSFYPLTREEVVIFAAEVFEEQRGRGIWPLLIQRTCQALGQDGIVNVCVDCKVWNHGSRRSIEKAGFRMQGVASRVNVFGNRFVVWKRQPRLQNEQQDTCVTQGTSAHSEGRNG